MNSADVKQFAVIILQSLGENDLKTGDILYNEIIKYKQFEEPNLHAEIYNVFDKIALIHCLANLAKRITAEGLFPILHLETHGYEDGIQLASGEKVEWIDMMPYCREINIQLRNQLIVVLAVCVGISILGAIMPDERAPFRVMIGAVSDVSQIDMRNGFENFYNIYFFTFNFKASVAALNTAIGDKTVFYILAAERIFDDLINPERNPVFFEQIVNEQAVLAKSEHPQLKRFGFAVVCAIVEKKIKKLFIKVSKEKDYFIMKDLNQ